MKRSTIFMAMVVLTLMVFGQIAYATPSTQIWIPSTDVQGYGKVHFGDDVYIKTESQDNGTTEATVTNLGLTVGVLPSQAIQMELGVDYRDVNGLHEYPIYLNAKLGTPEGSLFEGSPSIAIGGYDFGTKSDVTDYNLIYGIAAKTVGKLGRFSVGYYTGNDKLLVDIDGEKDNSGLLASWDRTISEVSDNLWLAIDYQGGKNGYGATSFGVAWKFAPNASVIFAYDIYNESTYKPTGTVQVDLDF